MAKKSEKIVDEQREMREELMKIAAFRKFIVSLMVKGHFIKVYRMEETGYERGWRDALCSIVEDFTIGTDDGVQLVAEYLDFIRTDKKEY